MADIQQERAAPVAAAKKVDRLRVQQLRAIHSKYTSALTPLYDRVRAAERWWRLHNDEEERKETEQGKDGGFTSRSGWLNNVVISKHADGMDAYPEPTVRPREETDTQTAEALSKVIPCVLELNGFRKVWSSIKWRKHKHGGGVYKVTWDPGKLNGLGDISVQSVNVLNLAWKPACQDIQQSPYFFHAENVDRDALIARYPAAEQALGAATYVARFAQEDEIEDLTNLVTVVECYYKVAVPTGLPGVSRNVLHYCVYTGDVVLYASEDDPDKKNGWYEHGLYPYEFDVLFPVEESAWGKGYIDEGKNAQTKIDLLDTAMVKNAMVGAIPRYFKRSGDGVNVEALLDLSNPIVPVDGDISDTGLREIPYKSLEGNYIALRDGAVSELREVTGNTESSTGNHTSGVTAASAIAALQEASGKVSRDENAMSYEAFGNVVKLCIELIRQFYTLPRTFRITGRQGKEEFVSFDNSGLRAAPMQGPGGSDGGLRKPEFDVIVGAQKAAPYTRIAQNELALQFFDKGFFNPAMAEQAVMCLEMMDFQGRDELIGKIQRNCTMQQKLLQYAQIALTCAPPQTQEMIAQDISATLGGQAPVGGGGTVSLTGTEAENVTRAREQSQARTQPQGG